MANFQDLLDAIAAQLGGTQPDATTNPHFYSSYKAGGTPPVTGLNGCYSVPPAVLQEPPVGVLVPGPFTVNSERAKDLLTQGEEYNVDDLKLYIFVRNNDPKTQFANLNPYRDSIPAVMRSHLQLGNPALITGQSILQVSVAAGRPGVFAYAGTELIGWEFTLRVIRMLGAIYAS